MTMAMVTELDRRRWWDDGAVRPRSQRQLVMQLLGSWAPRLLVDGIPRFL